MKLALYRMGEWAYRKAFAAYRPLYFSYKKWSDRGFIRLVQENAKPGMTVIDIGANIGFYSKILSQCVGPKGRVVSFEPSPTNFKHLHRLMRRFPQCETHQAAVTQESGKIQLYESTSFNVDHRIYDPRQADYPNTARIRISVSAVGLDDLFPPGTQIDFIKIDVQGAEFDVFRGMQRVLNENPRLRLVSEFWPHALKAAGEDARAFITFLGRLGFAIRLLDEKSGRLTEISEDVLAAENDRDRYFNIYCYRQSFHSSASPLPYEEETETK